MPQVDITHQVIVTDHPDEAQSLAGYFNEHGVFAVVCDDHEVRAASPNSETDSLIRTLKSTWQHFWDNSDSGLMGLPMFVKET
jgi:hypothetical protein